MLAVTNRLQEGRTAVATQFQREVFGRTLRAALDDHRMSQRALARAAGVTPNAVSQWVLGRATPQPEMVARLERILELEDGTLTRVLGYIPASVQDRALTSVLQSIQADPRLGDRERRILTAMYRELIRNRENGEGGESSGVLPDAQKPEQGEHLG
jgi:transcriptional regulator with XRE-family HTH domain